MGTCHLCPSSVYDLRSVVALSTSHHVPIMYSLDYEQHSTVCNNYNICTFILVHYTTTLQLLPTYPTLLDICTFFVDCVESEWNSSDVVPLSLTSASDDTCFVVSFLLDDFNTDNEDRDSVCSRGICTHKTHRDKYTYFNITRLFIPGDGHSSYSKYKYFTSNYYRLWFNAHYTCSTNHRCWMFSFRLDDIIILILVHIVPWIPRSQVTMSVHPLSGFQVLLKVFRHPFFTLGFSFFSACALCLL